jgi:tetratricopeptide (TPR) repeat protein
LLGPVSDLRLLGHGGTRGQRLILSVAWQVLAGLRLATPFCDKSISHSTFEMGYNSGTLHAKRRRRVLEPIAQPENSASTITEYEHALADITAAQVASDPKCLLRLLLLRDVVAATFDKAQSADLAARLVGADAALRNVSEELSDALPNDQLEIWRGSILPKSDAWWWRIDEVAVETAVQRSPWWPVLTGILLTISASLTADIARHFLSNGPDFYGALSTISQGAVTIIAGSSLTQAGRNWINRWLFSFGVRQEGHPRSYTLLAVAVLTLVGSFRACLPWIAIHYYDARGTRLFSTGKIHSAIENFERAISLAPSEYLPHYNLADALEEILDIDRAIGEYQAAIQANPDFYPAYNNLARLYLVKRKDYEGALRALRKGIIRLTAEREKNQQDCAHPNPQCDALYTLHKNFAWVNVEKQWFGLARIDVNLAIAANPNRGGIYCLLAQIESAAGNRDGATKSWTACLARAGAQIRGDKSAQVEDIEEIWIALAKEWLLDLASGRKQ